MLQITPQMKILVASQPTDFRRGIDGRQLFFGARTEKTKAVVGSP
jgi:hypothetical protein